MSSKIWGHCGSRPLRPEDHRQFMAHFPRWVDSSQLDSAAALSAYKWWLGTATPEEVEQTLPYLYVIDHRCPPFIKLYGIPVVVPAFDGRELPTRDCTDPQCLRCFTGRSGYMFRWIDRRWLDMYESIRRPGSLSFK